MPSAGRASAVTASRSGELGARMQRTDHGGFPGLLSERRNRHRERAGGQGANDFSSLKRVVPGGA